MKKKFLDFIDNLKEYISIIFKLNFGELFVYVLELCLVVLVSLMVYIPVGLVKDLIYSLFTIFISNRETLFNILDFIFYFISLICFVLVFIHIFNIRYGELQKAEKNKKEKKTKDDENIELPSMKK